MAQAPLVGFRTEIPNYSKKDPGHWTLTPRNTTYDPKHSEHSPPSFYFTRNSDISVTYTPLYYDLLLVLKRRSFFKKKLLPGKALLSGHC